MRETVDRGDYDNFQSGGSARKNPIKKEFLTVLNQLYELEQKIKKGSDLGSILRNIDKMRNAFSDLGLVYEDPTGQTFKETRTDLVATISGASTDNLVVVDVIKPIIRWFPHESHDQSSKIVQEGIVIVESRKGESGNE